MPTGCIRSAYAAPAPSSREHLADRRDRDFRRSDVQLERSNHPVFVEQRRRLPTVVLDALAVVRGEAFYVDQAGERELRICFSCVPPQRADDISRRLMRAQVRASGASMLRRFNSWRSYRPP